MSFNESTRRAFGILRSHLENGLPDNIKRRILNFAGERIAAATKTIREHPERGNKRDQKYSSK